MVLPTVGPPEVTLNPFAFRQTFSISPSSLRDDEYDFILTEPSLLGYRFAIQRSWRLTSELRPTSPFSDTTRPPSPDSPVFGSRPPPVEQLSVFFDQHGMDTDEFTAVEITLHVSGNLASRRVVIAIAQSGTVALPKVGEISVLAKETAILSISVLFPNCNALPLAPMPRSLLLNAVNDSMQGEDLIDVVFYAYTMRKGDKLVLPQRLFGSKKILLNHCDYLDNMLNPQTFKNYTDKDELTVDAYSDYADSDSDLECEYEEGDEEPAAALLQPGVRSRRNSDASVGSVKSFHSSLDSPNIALNHAHSKAKVEVAQEAVNGNEVLKTGLRVQVMNFAFPTWRALVSYIYTGRIMFLPLSSQEIELVTTDITAVPCSAKSMYRLADMMGLDELKKKAFKHIKRCLSEENIIDELFSRFTSMYDEVQTAEIDLFVDLYENLEDRFTERLENDDKLVSGPARRILAQIMSKLYRTQRSPHSSPRETVVHSSPLFWVVAPSIEPEDTFNLPLLNPPTPPLRDPDDVLTPLPPMPPVVHHFSGKRKSQQRKI